MAVQTCCEQVLELSGATSEQPPDDTAAWTGNNMRITHLAQRRRLLNLQELKMLCRQKDVLFTVVGLEDRTVCMRPICSFRASAPL